MPKRTSAYFKRLGTGCRFDPYHAPDRLFLAPPTTLPITISEEIRDEKVFLHARRRCIGNSCCCM